MFLSNRRLPLLVTVGLFASAPFASAQEGQPAEAAPPPSAPAQPVAPAPDDKLQDMERRLRAMEEERTKEKAAAAAAKAEADKTDKDYHPEKVPFAFGDFSWAPGNYSPPMSVLSWGPFTGELRTDVNYHFSFNQPKDDTISGSSEVFRHNEFQLTQLGIGGDFYYKGVHARLMTQFGMYSFTTPRNDSSPGKGQWNLDGAYRYISEAYGGYHINVLHGINIQAGIFMSYVGLWSYYNFDNWTYQPSYVSSNTPWFFNGARIQIFPTEKLKIEPWFVNGWQSYGKFNQAPGLGLQILWKPREWITILGNQYYGTDTLGIPNRQRLHTDDSVMVRLYNRPDSPGLSKAAASLTVDLGCEFGDPMNKVSCNTQYFVGFMAYLRLWLMRDMFGLTVGGGAISNPGRYLVLLPPINGATAFTGTPYFTENPGDPFQAWDMQVTLDFMPTRNITFRAEFNHRAASVPYFSGAGGVTPPGGNTGDPTMMISGWTPDLAFSEDRFTWAMLVRL